MICGDVICMSISCMGNVDGKGSLDEDVDVTVLIGTTTDNGGSVTSSNVNSGCCSCDV